MQETLLYKIIRKKLSEAIKSNTRLKLTSSWTNTYNTQSILHYVSHDTHMCMHPPLYDYKTHCLYAHTRHTMHMSTACTCTHLHMHRCTPACTHPPSMDMHTPPWTCTHLHMHDPPPPSMDMHTPPHACTPPPLHAHAHTSTCMHPLLHGHAHTSTCTCTPCMHPPAHVLHAHAHKPHHIHMQVPTVLINHNKGQVGGGDGVWLLTFTQRSRTSQAQDLALFQWEASQWWGVWDRRGTNLYPKRLTPLPDPKYLETCLQPKSPLSPLL